MHHKSVEVIMAAYNQELNTKLVLDGYLRQTYSNFSICIADDGSGPEIKNLVNTYQRLGLNIRHVWHEDNSFRRARIINKSIEDSVADYIILTDNDCIPSQHFVADYISELNNEHLFLGRRVDLYPPVTDALKSHKLSLDKLESPFFLLKQSMIKGLKRPEMALRFPDFIYRQWNRYPRPALGANMAVSRKALLAVNGFDNDFQGYGFEDSDLERRLLMYGLKPKTVLGRCALFHLYHPEKLETEVVSKLFLQKKTENNMICKDGIQHDS